MEWRCSYVEFVHASRGFDWKQNNIFVARKNQKKYTKIIKQNTKYRQLCWLRKSRYPSQIHKLTQILSKKCFKMLQKISEKSNKKNTTNLKISFFCCNFFKFPTISTKLCHYYSRILEIFTKFAPVLRALWTGFCHHYSACFPTGTEEKSLIRLARCQSRHAYYHNAKELRFLLSIFKKRYRLVLRIPLTL